MLPISAHNGWWTLVVQQCRIAWLGLFCSSSNFGVVLGIHRIAGKVLYSICGDQCTREIVRSKMTRKAVSRLPREAERQNNLAYWSQLVDDNVDDEQRTRCLICCLYMLSNCSFWCSFSFLYFWLGKILHFSVYWQSHYLFLLFRLTAILREQSS